MRHSIHSISTTFMAILSSGLTLPSAMADNRDDQVEARLSGFNEVHFIAGPPAALRGAISTAASGAFSAKIFDRAKIIRYELRYRGLEGTVSQAHIHFGQNHTVGGIVVWLCETEGTPAPADVAAATPTCPQAGVVTGTITPAQVLTATGQGLNAGEFDELVRAIQAGATYTNVHSSLFPPGEVRGQIEHH
jgi:hypothetical protein